MEKRKKKVVRIDKDKSFTLVADLYCDACRPSMAFEGG